MLGFFKEEVASGDEVGSIEGDFDGIEVSDAANGMNRSIVGAWAKDSPRSNGGQTPATDNKEVTFESRKRQVNGEPLPKRRKAAPQFDRSPPTHVSLADLGGVDSVIQQMEDLIVLPLLQPQIYATSKIQPPRGVLLHGPPGCGESNLPGASLGAFTQRSLYQEGR